jgi:hypothetical protein
MPSSVDTRTWGPSSSAGLSDRRPMIVLAAAGLLAGLLIAPRLGLPRHAPPLTITNPTDYTVSIEASDPRDPGWTPVAAVPGHRSQVETDVVDEGAVWDLRFSSQGVTLTGYQVTRAQLAAGHWTYAVPADVAARLSASGADPNP